MAKKLLIFLFFPICLSLTGTTYYISPSGKDSNPGTLSQPFFTLNKVWTVISAGDIVYLRGGIYKFSSQQYLTGKNGTESNIIRILAYPDETPIISRQTPWTFIHYVSGIYFSGDYFHWKGIKISGFTQISDEMWAGMELENSNHNVFEQLTFSHNGNGADLGGYCDDNLFLNCDFHHNYDPNTARDPYGNADGLSLLTDEGTTNTIRGCRAWSNSDDGFDALGSTGFLLIDGCWAWMNGYREDAITPAPGGNGFKLGGGEDSPTSHLRTVTNCISFHNEAGGFIQNEGLMISWLFNNTAYHNSDAASYNLNFQFAEKSIVHILKNNIAFANQHPTNLQANYDNCIEDHNTWDGIVTVDEEDFVSIDSIGVSGGRGSSGSLPDINFLKLVKGSDLIDAGEDVGLAYNGLAPDLGAFEFQSGLPAPSPAYLSSVIDNETPSLLQMTFDLNLDNSKIPATSSFIVAVNSQTRAINSLSISGNKVQLNLTLAVVFGDQVTVSYTKPTLNPLQSISGGVVANISNSSVTNNCKNKPTSKDPPVVIIKAPAQTYAGFVNMIDATSTYDPQNDPLIVNWIVPNDVPVSTSINNLKTQFLAPIVENPVDLAFQLKVSNGDTLLAKNISIAILPYKPELTFVRITKIKASDFAPPDYPENILDGNLQTKWSSKGDNKWLRFLFAEPFKISHIEVAFLNGQQFESYFDIYASKDSINWEPILINVASCSFSGGKQVFNFPDESNNTEYSYLKFIGHGNALNTWNYISEFKIFGSVVKHPGSGEIDTRKVIIYPNPASSYMNISIIDPKLKPDDLRIRDLLGKTVFEKLLNPNNQNIQIPLILKPGIYSVDLIKGKLTLFSQKLIVIR